MMERSSIAELDTFFTANLINEINDNFLQMLFFGYGLIFKSFPYNSNIFDGLLTVPSNTGPIKDTYFGAVGKEVGKMSPIKMEAYETVPESDTLKNTYLGLCFRILLKYDIHEKEFISMYYGGLYYHLNGYLNRTFRPSPYYFIYDYMSNLSIGLTKDKGRHSFSEVNIYDKCIFANSPAHTSKLPFELVQISLSTDKTDFETTFFVPEAIAKKLNLISRTANLKNH